MNPIDPAELSAYLDGEVGADRRHEIEAVLAGDPAARAELDALAAADAVWRASARSAAFRPRVEMPARGAGVVSMRLIALFVAMLIVGEGVLRLLDVPRVALAFDGVALGVVLAALCWTGGIPGPIVYNEYTT
jgi:anti-sigma factor RsiW